MLPVRQIRQAVLLLLVLQVAATVAVTATVLLLQRRKRARRARERQTVYYARKKARYGEARELFDTLSSPPTSEQIQACAHFSLLSPAEACARRPIVNVRAEHRLPISVRWQRNVMEQWTDAEWLENVRLSRRGFMWLLGRLQPRLTLGTGHRGGKRPTPPWALLAAVLCWLGGARPADLREKFGMRKSCFKQRRWLVLEVIVGELAKEFVCFPRSEAEYAEISAGMKGWCGFEGAIGAVDGLIIRMKSLGGQFDKVMRCDRHDCYGLNLQAIVNANDQFTWFSDEKFGSCADGRALRESVLFRELEGGLLTAGGSVPVGKYFILGDNAYPLRSFLLHPFKGSHAPGSMEDTWNLYMSAARAAIERAFGQLVLAFKILKNGIPADTIPRARLITRACVVLHNIRKHLQERDVERPASVASAGDMNTLDDAVNFVRGFADDTVGERRPEDRHVAAQMRSRIGEARREELGWQLLGKGLVR